MPIHPSRYRRKNPRLREYAYDTPGIYFITAVTHLRNCLFNDPRAQRIVHEAWHLLPNRFPCVSLDAFTIQPDHIHGLIALEDSRNKVSLFDLMRIFKSGSAKQINAMLNTPGVPVWQPRFFDRVVRGPRELERIRRYVVENTRIHAERVRLYGAFEERR